MEFLETAQQAARLAGEVLIRWSKTFTATEKRPADFVTEADFESQEVIHLFIEKRYPDHQFLGEEGLEEGDTDSPYRWVIDPLDGTSNYVHGFPYYAVSIALEHCGELIVGVVYDPNRDEMFSASRGQGARLNSKAISPSCRSDLSQALVVASLPIGVHPKHPAVQEFLEVLSRAQHTQRTGSAALNLAYVACGRIDAYWSQSLHSWDMAGGAVLVAEAGGLVTKRNGDPLDIGLPDLLATNGPAIHEQLRQLFL